MSKYTITHSCGHDETHQLQGKVNSRERKAEWLKSQPCTACRKAAEAADRAEANAKAAEANAAAGLPELTGSPKQIAWAETIRAQQIADADSTISTMEGNMSKAPEGQAEIAEKLLDAAKAIYQEIKGQAEASWWIDRRDSKIFAEAIRAVYQEIKAAK